MNSRLELLPNEILLEIFFYFETRDLYRAFNNLNRRFDSLLRSVRNLSLSLEKNETNLIRLVASRVVRLELNTWHEVNLSHFDHLKVLIFRRTTRRQVSQIRPKILPHLVFLSLSLSFDFWSSTQLAEEVFSNGFRHLRHADLGRVDIPLTHSWSLSTHLRSLSVCSTEAIIIPLVLSSCPNLKSLRVEIFGNQHRLVLPSLRLPHSLTKFTFADSYGILSIDEIDFLLSYMPKVRTIDLTLAEISLERLTQSLVDRLIHLKDFQLSISEPIDVEHSALPSMKIQQKTNAIRCSNQ